MAKNSPHGTRQRYRSGCRCADCRKASSDYSLALQRAKPDYREKHAAAVLRGYYRNKEKKQAVMKAYRETPEGRAVRMRHHFREKGSDLTPQVVRFLPVLFSDPCSYCGGEANEIDHIDPISRGGTGEVGNLTAVCGTCNRRKRTKSLLYFLLTR